jgi:EAL domain-containing protein (putative c-di-GMP-specific phosphodiesterase class I)
MESALRDLFEGRGAADRRRGQRPELASTDANNFVPRHHLTVHFQPQFEVATGRGLGVEALARWTGADGKPVLPSVFVPLSERTRVVGALGTWVLREACQSVAAWHDMGMPLPTLSINLSALQVNNDLCVAIENIIDATGLPGPRLELEITEGVLIPDRKLAVECLWRLKNRGVHIAMDEFGTGYSNYSYLSTLPVDRLKLDKSFAERMTRDKRTAAIVRSLIAMGREIDIAVMAEGIETERQFGMLEEMGCTEAQGCLFARPALANQARTLLMTPWGERRVERTASAN